MPVQIIRHTKVSDNFVSLVKIQESNWQYLTENFISRTKYFDPKEKITKRETKILKKIERNYKTCRHVYNGIYKTIAENFYEYLHTLELDETEELKNYIKSNGWGLKTIQEYDSSFELRKSLDIFHYLNSRFPYRNSLPWVPDGDKLDFISGEKVSLKRLSRLFCSTHLHRLVSIQFLAMLNLFLGGKEEISKDALAEVYHNLLLQALSKNENIEPIFEKIMELVK